MLGLELGLGLGLGLGLELAEFFARLPAVVERTCLFRNAALIVIHTKSAGRYAQVASTIRFRSEARYGVYLRPVVCS